MAWIGTSYLQMMLHSLRIGSELEGSDRYPDTISSVRVVTWER